MPQMKGQKFLQEVNEMESMYQIKVQTMVIRMLKKLRGRMDDLSKNLYKEIVIIKDDIEIIKNNQSGMKNIIYEMKNKLEETNSRLNEAEYWISNLGDKVSEKTQLEQKKM